MSEDNHKCQSYGEQFDSAMRCESREQAEHWMEKEVRHYVEHHDKSPEEAVQIIKHNLDYMAGYHSSAAAQKVHDLFSADHPVFGAFHL